MFWECTYQDMHYRITLFLRVPESLPLQASGWPSRALFLPLRSGDLLAVTRREGGGTPVQAGGQGVQQPAGPDYPGL